VLTESTVSTALVRFVMDAAQRSGIPASDLAARAGIPMWALADNSVRISAAGLCEFWERAQASVAGKRFSLRAAGLWRPGRLHLYDYLVGSCQTLEAALTAGVHYNNVVSGGTEVRLREADDRVTLEYRILTTDPEMEQLVSEFALALILEQIRYGVGEPVTPLHVGLTARAPALQRDVLDTWQTRADFGLSVSSMTFSRADAGRPLRFADSDLSAILRHYADLVVGSPSPPVRWEDRFRTILAAALANGSASLALVAQQLAISPRTLQRRLEALDTSWRAEIDLVRRNQAASLLRHGELTNAAIASRLGYSDARALRRAVRRWADSSEDTGGQTAV
jgi:AraC-like DNA-binding protein